MPSVFMVKKDREDLEEWYPMKWYSRVMRCTSEWQLDEKLEMYHVGHVYMKKTDEGVLFDDFAEDFFFGAETSFWIELAEGMELIYGHYDEDRGDAEFIHIKNGICLREYRMYDFEVDTDEGDIPEFESWGDVSSYVDENLLFI